MNVSLRKAGLVIAILMTMVFWMRWGKKESPVPSPAALEAGVAAESPTPMSGELTPPAPQATPATEASETTTSPSSPAPLEQRSEPNAHPRESDTFSNRASDPEQLAADRALLTQAEHQRDPRNPWQEKTAGGFRVGDFLFARMRPLKDPQREIEFKLKVRRITGIQLVPQWIRLGPSPGTEETIPYDSFVSGFADREVYVGLLAFPYDTFWQQIDPESRCDEIAFLYDGIQSTQKQDRILGFNGRVFCRTGLRSLSGIASFTASTSQP